jgi:hypothetical protein
MNRIREFETTWVKVGVICGLLACVAYTLSTQVSISFHFNYFLFFAFGPLLCMASVGLYHFLKRHRNSVKLQAGSLFLFTSGVVTTMMATMQGSIRYLLNQYIGEAPDESTREILRLILRGVDTTQLGLDIAFDIFISVGTFLIAMAMLTHPKFGNVFGYSGMIVSGVGLLFNLITFPLNPGTRGLIDAGPFFGIWFTVVAIQVIRSLKWMDTTETDRSNGSIVP